jgi:hypothetical protein
LGKTALANAISSIHLSRLCKFDYHTSAAGLGERAGAA